MSTPARRLLVHAAPNAPNPRHIQPLLGTLVLGHRTHTLPREGEHAAEVIRQLDAQPFTVPPNEAVAAVGKWLVSELGVTTVLPVWCYEHQQDGELRLRAGARLGDFNDPWHSVLAGIIYDTPDGRAATKTTAELIPQTLIQEVNDYDRWRNREAFAFLIEEQDQEGVWHAVAAGFAYDHERARRRGEQRWRELYGTLYSEVGPNGPCVAEPASALGRLSQAFRRRFVRALTDGRHYGVVDVECYVCDDNSFTGGVPRPVLTQVTRYTRCMDPNDPDRTATEQYTAHRDAPTPQNPTLWSAAARNLCAAYDPDTLDWDGEYIL